MTDQPPDGARLSDTCIDCGEGIALCAHAMTRLFDPVMSFHAGLVEELRAENAALRAEIVRAATFWHVQEHGGFMPDRPLETCGYDVCVRALAAVQPDPPLAEGEQGP
jgi:hypothetical protein